MGVSKVVLGEETLVDLTSDSVNEENLLEGATAHGANGEPVKGTVEIKPKTLTTTKTGEQIHLVDSTDNKAVEFALYGKATQDGTPTPANPVEIELAGASGSVEVKSENEDGTKSITATFSTPNGLAGIKVSSNGNYTDQNGQQWICDEIVKYADGSGAYIQRVGKVEFPKEIANYAVNSAVEGIEPFFVLSMDYFKKDVSATKLITSSTHFQYGNPYNEQGEILCAYVFRSGGIRFRINGVKTLNELATWLETNSPQVLYELYEPITTPLTAEELAEISTFYPVTNISNDFDCGMNVEYVLEKVITTQAPIPVIPSTEVEELKSGDTTLTLFGKIKKWLTSIKPHAFLNPVNNLLATVYGSALDATQGKVLDDKITKITETFIITRATLEVGETEIAIENSKITENSALSFYTSIYGVNPTKAVVTTGSVTLTFDAQETDMEVGVRIDG